MLDLNGIPRCHHRLVRSIASNTLADQLIVGGVRKSSMTDLFAPGSPAWPARRRQPTKQWLTLVAIRLVSCNTLNDFR